MHDELQRLLDSLHDQTEDHAVKGCGQVSGWMHSVDSLVGHSAYRASWIKRLSRRAPTMTAAQVETCRAEIMGHFRDQKTKAEELQNEMRSEAERRTAAAENRSAVQATPSQPAPRQAEAITSLSAAHEQIRQLLSTVRAEAEDHIVGRDPRVKHLVMDWNTRVNTLYGASGMCMAEIERFSRWVQRLPPTMMEKSEADVRAKLEDLKAKAEALQQEMRRASE